MGRADFPPVSLPFRECDYTDTTSNGLSRLSVCEKEFGKDDTLSVFCARVADIRRATLDDEIKGWRGVRMMDLDGKNCGSVALVQFTFMSVP